ncbi:universal stress protein [Lysobacter sp. KIS68-7]|uniref:universal stress protein n=1 Tax=Lysobacter sp. KIS68-7 TaxID=2904252 RepID=UPI001E38FA64|nr:universal stress protein [Lysobacter sp. KIS68-7]UHQ18322.1 universal stress protein [Lysobacter sp. KIS68-7]
MLKDLFFPVTGASTDDATLAIAEQIADAYRARLIISVPVAVPEAVAAPWGFAPGPVLAQVLEEVEIRATKRAEELRRRMANSKIASDVRMDRTRLFDAPEALTLQARYADLSVIAKPRGDDASIAHAFFNAFLFESGRPVMVVPANIASCRFDRLLLAWKPTREATRAIHDALALFSPREVEVLVVDPEIGDLGHGDEPGADIAAHLAERGLNVRVTRRPSGTMSVATTVRLHAAERGADLIVAGGYGHSRMREWVLGGATRDLIESLELPVLFSH